MFTICPDCGNEKLKVKAMEKRTYDPATTRTTVQAGIAMVEYNCHACGWNILLEDPPFIPEELQRQYDEEKASQASGRS